MKAIKFLFVISTFGLTSCYSTQLVQIQTTENIPIYYQGHLPNDKPYEIVGLLETSGWIFTSNSKLVNGMEKRAKKIGADAVIDLRFGYIPHIITGIPYAQGIAVKWK